MMMFCRLQHRMAMKEVTVIVIVMKIIKCHCQSAVIRGTEASFGKCAVFGCALATKLISTFFEYFIALLVVA